MLSTCVRPLPHWALQRMSRRRFLLDAPLPWCVLFQKQSVTDLMLYTLSRRRYTYPVALASRTVASPSSRPYDLRGRVAL